MKKLNQKVFYHLVPFLILANTTSVYAAEKSVSDIAGNLSKAAFSFGPVISIAAFIVGMIALFRAVTTIMNHSENPRENPMKNVVFFGVAAAVGLGYSFFSSSVLQTVFGKDDNSDNVKNDIFKVN